MEGPKAFTKRSRTYRSRRHTPVHDQHCSTYLLVGVSSTICIGGFLLLYLSVNLVLIPLFTYEPRTPELALLGHDGIQRRQRSNRRTLNSSSKRRIGAADDFRKSQGGCTAIEKDARPSRKRAGFVVLGMHRSGTSVLTGLLVMGCEYNIGGPLIKAHYDNERGFFERIDVVRQNDEFMEAQNISWATGVLEYDYQKALDHKEEYTITFRKGYRAVAFLNNASNAPWLQKDPRLCITLKTWLKLLNTEPAVVFTYRHPLEVAMSLVKRNEGFSLEQGLRLWILYNMRALQNSAGLCRVLTSNEAFLSDPLTEVQRISDELTSKCNVPAPGRKLNKEIIDQFVDESLQHNKKQRQANEHQGKVLEVHDGCEVREFESNLPSGSQLWKEERGMYLTAMKIFCDFRSCKAYENDYVWPEL